MAYKSVLKEGFIFAEANLEELAGLIYDWKKTGLLNNGEHCKLHDLAKILGDLPAVDRMRLAESIVMDACLKRISGKVE